MSKIIKNGIVIDIIEDSTTNQEHHISQEPTLEERVTELEKYNSNIIATLTRQLTRYLEKKIITQQEHDELISLMEAKELVAGE